MKRKTKHPRIFLTHDHSTYYFVDSSRSRYSGQDSSVRQTEKKHISQRTIFYSQLLVSDSSLRLNIFDVLQSLN